jgi:hypothetical protein
MDTATTTDQKKPKLAPHPLAPSQRQLQLSREYISSPLTPSAIQMKAIRALAIEHDDLTRIFGIKIYDTMRRDSAIDAALNIFFSAVLARGLELINPLQEGDPDFEEADKWRQFAQLNIDRLKTPISATLFDMCFALVYGLRIAEMNYESAEIMDGEGIKTCLVDIKVKDMTTIALAVDEFLNVLGIVPLLRPVYGLSGIKAINPDANKNIPEVIPIEKFFIFSWRVFNADPRGESQLRSLYHAYHTKKIVWDLYVTYLRLYANPSIVGFTPENAIPYIPTDEEGIPLDPLDTVATPEQQMANELQTLTGPGVAAFPGGAKVELLQPSGSGEVFLHAIHNLNGELVKGILGQTLMTEESASQGRAASQTHQDVFGIVLRFFVNLLEEAINDRVITPLIGYNYPPNPKSAKMMPRASLGAVEHQDFATVASSISALARSGYLHLSQYVGIDKMMSLPQRDIKAQMDEIKQKQQAAQDQIDQQMQLKKDQMGAKLSGRPGGGSQPPDRTPRNPK